MKIFVLFCIRQYRSFLSFDRGFFRLIFPSFATCRYTPSCSEYAYQAIKKYGILLGSAKAVKRISRCHPGYPGGLDPLK